MDELEDDVIEDPTDDDEGTDEDEGTDDDERIDDEANEELERLLLETTTCELLPPTIPQGAG